mmetsp:Transcript_63638/g.186174  ORF Transcript_63638/g.186174 Transcript_63638/m.186174 type:complete len:234 (-) Transcript_63638:102-803(-)
MPAMEKMGLQRATPRGRSLARCAMFFIFHSTQSMWRLRITEASRSIMASGPALRSLTSSAGSCWWCSLMISRPMTMESSFSSLWDSRWQKFECPWPILLSYSSSSGPDQWLPTLSLYRTFTPTGHQRKSAQKPGSLVESRPCGKNSSWMSLTPMMLKGTDQRASFLGVFLTVEKSGILHSTRLTYASSQVEDSSEALMLARSSTERRLALIALASDLSFATASACCLLRSSNW